MRIRLLNVWFSLRASFWFVPALMVGIVIGLSFATVTLDEFVKERWLKKFSTIYSGSPEGAREVLSTIAGSMIGVTGVVFSITIVALQLASSQFGPRLLRNFMRDLGNQIVLGTFISTFVYCLLVLRTVRGLDDDTFVPDISITFGILLALVSLGVLIYFIHHMSVSIQVDNVIARVGDELQACLKRLFPEKIAHGTPGTYEPRRASDIPADFEQTASPVAAAADGYLQAVDGNALIELATAHDLLLRLAHRPGDFMIQGQTLALVYPGDRVDESIRQAINEACILGAQSTQEQDIAFVFRQLVEIAMRSLSPGINDPHTAVRCIDRIGAGLCQLAERVLPSPYRYDEEERLRVIAPTETFANLTQVVFSPIRAYGRSHKMVTGRLLEIIAAIAEHVHREEDRAALLQQAMLIEHGSHEGLPEACDRKDIEARYIATLRALEIQTMRQDKAE